MHGRSPARWQRTLAAIGTLSVTAVVLTGCVGVGTQPSQTQSSGSSAAVTPKIDPDKKITLTVWTAEAQRFDEQKQLTASFEKKYPNVTVKLVQRAGTTDYNTQLKIAMTGRTPPDVVEGNNGFALDAALVKAHLIIPLDKYATALGWTTRYTPSILKQWRLGPEGTTYGTGELWGTGMAGEIGGWYYNKSALAALGKSVPTTFAEFEDVLAAAKTAGKTPIMLGNLGGWEATHLFNMVNDQNAPEADLTGIAFTDRNAKWDSAAFVKSASTLAAWAKAGYFPKGYEGYDQDSAIAKFVAGTGIFMQCGSWCTPSFAKMGDDVGYFLSPPVTAGAVSKSTGSISTPFHVAATSKNPDAAVLYIDWITNEAASTLYAQGGDLPGVALSSPPTGQSALATAVFADYTSTLKNGALMPYPDWSLPQTGSVYYAKLQEILGGITAPATAMAQVQANRITYYDQQGVPK